MSNWTGVPDYVRQLTRVGLEDARAMHEASEEAGWDAEDTVHVNDRTDVNDWGYDEAFDLQFFLYGDPVVCYCGCSELLPSFEFERWSWAHDGNHLSWLMDR